MFDIQRVLESFTWCSIVTSEKCAVRGHYILKVMMLYLKSTHCPIMRFHFEVRITDPVPGPCYQFSSHQGSKNGTFFRVNTHLKHTAVWQWFRFQFAQVRQGRQVLFIKVTSVVLDVLPSLHKCVCSCHRCCAGVALTRIYNMWHSHQFVVRKLELV